jgi:hypothetical protein
MIHKRLACVCVVLCPLLMGQAPGSPQVDALDATALLKRARDITSKTAKLRGLRVRRRIAMGVLSREEIVKRIERKLAREYTEAEIEAEAAMLKLLGLLPEAIDYRKTVLDLLKDQVAGFYDPMERKLNLAAWIPISLQEPALAHEICHALQDQHFGLRKFIKPIKDNSDQQLARAALVEGDCTGVMLEYILIGHGLDLSSMPDAMAQLARRGLANEGSPAFKAAPAFLKETLIFPYLYGLGFMQRVRTRHPWHRVNPMYRRPPESTEQVLHYDKYWARERPIPIRSRPLPALASAGHVGIKEEVLGEFQLSLYLRQGVSEAVAQRAAAGWGGDRLVAYRKKEAAAGDRPLLVHLTTWDADEDALEFANALRHVLTKRGFTATTSSPGLWVYSDAEGNSWSVQLHRRHVLTLGALPEELRVKLQQQVWAQWRVGGRRVPPP